MTGERRPPAPQVQPMQLDLLRHAKSSWAEPGQDDHERPLNRRGARDAAAIGRYLADRGALPQRVLCSSALRTRETWTTISRRLPGDPPIEWVVDPDLYLASPATLIGKLRALPAELERVLVLAHNPGIAALAIALSREGGGSTDLGPLRSKYPTAGLATLEIEAPWAEISPGRGLLRQFLRPKDLV